MTHRQEMQELARDLTYIKTRMEGLHHEYDGAKGSESQVLGMILGISVIELGDLIRVLERASDELGVSPEPS